MTVDDEVDGDIRTLKCLIESSSMTEFASKPYRAAIVPNRAFLIQPWFVGLPLRDLPPKSVNEYDGQASVGLVATERRILPNVVVVVVVMGGAFSQDFSGLLA